MVVRTQNGEVFIVGDNGPGEHAQGILWESFRLFRATGQMSWKRRTTTVDPITRQKVDGDPLDLGKIWIAIEPTDREENERRLNTSFERARFSTASDVRADYLIRDSEMIGSAVTLGLQIGFFQCLKP